MQRKGSQGTPKGFYLPLSKVWWEVCTDNHLFFVRAKNKLRNVPPYTHRTPAKNNPITSGSLLHVLTFWCDQACYSLANHPRAWSSSPRHALHQLPMAQDKAGQISRVLQHTEADPIDCSRPKAHWVKDAQKCFAATPVLWSELTLYHPNNSMKLKLWGLHFPCSPRRQQIKITWMTLGSTRHWSQWLQQLIPLSISYIRQTSTCRSLCKQYPEMGPSAWP